MMILAATSRSCLSTTCSSHRNVICLRTLPASRVNGRRSILEPCKSSRILTSPPSPLLTSAIRWSNSGPAKQKSSNNILRSWLSRRWYHFRHGSPSPVSSNLANQSRLASPAISTLDVHKQQRRWWHPGHSGNPPLKLGDNPGEIKPVSNMEIVKTIANYVWPADKPEIRARVVISLGELFLLGCGDIF